MLSLTQIQAIADACHAGGYDFQLALKTAARDGVPWFRQVTPDSAIASAMGGRHA